MKSDKSRPTFKAVKTATGYASPEELFYKLSRREKTHGYLRGPQQDVLREYAELPADSTDIAFELPTGTGKTAVGLLISEWKRLQSNKVAYLSLTNQLAGQVLKEAERFDISCADLRGTKDTRDRSEEGRYKTGDVFDGKPLRRETLLAAAVFTGSIRLIANQPA
jgi:superfamily II DNA or RNA helicase